MNKIIEVGDKIEIIKKKADENDISSSYYSKIQDITTLDELIVMAPIQKGTVVPLELNEEYYLCIYTNRGLYRCDSILIDRLKNENMAFLKFKSVSKLLKFQRRKYFRLDCMLSFQYKDEENEIWQQGIIMDISGGGLRFTSNGKQPEDSQVVCHIQLKLDSENKHIYVSGSIIESLLIDKDTDTYENRVLFETISSEVRELIIKFIFEQERLRRSRTTKL